VGASRSITVMSFSAAETRLLGTCLAEWLRPGELVAASGELGAGKSCLLRAVIEALGYAGKVRSPSFNIVSVYETGKPVAHVDLFRVERGELFELGIEELISTGKHIVLVEWGEKLAPDAEWTVKVLLKSDPRGVREILLEASSAVPEERFLDLRRRVRSTGLRFR